MSIRLSERFKVVPAASLVVVLALLSVVLLPCTGAVGQEDIPEASPQPEPREPDLPGAPVPVETLEETTEAAPQVTPTVDPTVNSPIPGITNTQIPGALTGRDSVFGNTNGNSNDTVSLYGSSAVGRSAVFVIDASGSMISKMPYFLKHLEEAIEGLPAHLSVTIIVFNGNGITEVPGGGDLIGLRRATREFRQELVAWIAPESRNVVCRGSGSRHAIPAIERALGYEPEMIFLVSDNLTGSGRHEVYQADIIDAISRANTREPITRINTIQMIDPDPLEKMGMQGTLERIADETGGNYKFLDDRELSLR